jgi:hypothetical protein
LLLSPTAPYRLKKQKHLSHGLFFQKMETGFDKLIQRQLDFKHLSIPTSTHSIIFNAE